MADYNFTLSGVSLPDGEDPLGVWTVPQETSLGAPQGDAFSFSAGAAQAGAPSTTEPTWRIALPADPEQAQAILEARIHAGDLAQFDLTKINRELGQLDPSGAGASFSASDELATQKTALLDTLNAYDATDAVSFGLFRRKDKDKASGVDEQTANEWVRFMEQTRQVIANYARIETVLGEVFVGHTSVTWTGDFKTRWDLNVDPTMRQTHRQSVHMALASRIALMRVISVVAVGAAGLAAKAAVPGGQVLLLPAVWRFVKDVLKELRKSWPQLQHLA